MSVRSFEQIVGSPDPIKLSTLLRGAYEHIRNNRSCFICNAANIVLQDLGLEESERLVQYERVQRLLAENNIAIHGGFVTTHATRMGIDTSRPMERVARLAVLDVLIHNLQKEGL